MVYTPGKYGRQKPERDDEREAQPTVDHFDLPPVVVPVAMLV